MINDGNFRDETPDAHLPYTSEQLKDLLGPVTGIYTDMFNIDWDVYDQSKLWFITDVGPDRQEYLSWLQQHQIAVVEPNSSFGWIKIVVPDKSTMEVLKDRFGRNLSIDN